MLSDSGSRPAGVRCLRRGARLLLRPVDAGKAFGALLLAISHRLMFGTGTIAPARGDAGHLLAPLPLELMLVSIAARDRQGWQRLAAGGLSVANRLQNQCTLGGLGHCVPFAAEEAQAGFRPRFFATSSTILPRGVPGQPFSRRVAVALVKSAARAPAARPWRRQRRCSCLPLLSQHRLP